MEKENELPSVKFFRKQTIFYGGNKIIVGLTKRQADIIVTKAKTVKSDGNEPSIIDQPFTQHEMTLLKRLGKVIPSDSVAVLLGTTQDAHEALFKELGISTHTDGPFKTKI